MRRDPVSGRGSSSASTATYTGQNPSAGSTLVSHAISFGASQCGHAP